jgi:hypothetical protein
VLFSAIIRSSSFLVSRWCAEYADGATCRRMTTGDEDTAGAMLSCNQRA